MIDAEKGRVERTVTAHRLIGGRRENDRVGPFENVNMSLC